MSTNMSEPVSPVPNSPGESGRLPSGASPREDSCGRPIDRRRRRRALISSPIRVRCEGVTGDGPDEVSTTIDVSRAGVLFLATLSGYTRGMNVWVTFPYSKAWGQLQAEQEGTVVRVTEMADGRSRVAVALGTRGVGEELVDASGRKLNEPGKPCANEASTFGVTYRPNTRKPLVLVVDSEPFVRETVKVLLNGEGYEVIAVNNAPDGRDVLNLFTPVLVIAEVEGEGFPGYDICAHVKGTPRLRCVPVVLTTRSAYPSDYASAHSLGALVCMAKPFRKERLAHVVRLLAPLPGLKRQSHPLSSKK
jgi:CheY-like chemotaxis protein